MGEYYITVTTTLSTRVAIPKGRFTIHPGEGEQVPVASRCVDILFAIDAGTTGVRTLAVDLSGQVLDVAYRPLTQHFPFPGWVEHDGKEIIRLVLETLNEAAQRALARSYRVVAIGITNQRETTIAFDRATGEPLARAIVWQDRRTADLCDTLRQRGVEAEIRSTTGLVLDPYFSATKMSWLLSQGVANNAEQLALSTIDSWVLWNLTGGSSGGVFATDPSNASRTMLFDLENGSWSEPLAEMFDIPLHALATIVPSAGRIGTIAASVLPSLAGVAISSIIGDQQGALFGQACYEPGMAKATYGTGSFVLQNIGTTLPEPAHGLTTSVAWQLGAGAPLTYALEGSAFVAGAAIQWLRDELQLIEASEDLEPLALTVERSDGVMVVPAFTGLGSPWFDPRARGTITGLSRGSGRAQIARAVIEALAYQVTAMVDQMVDSAEQPLTTLRVDGGASAMSLLCQLQANQLGVFVERPKSLETTALGAATLAAFGEGLLDPFSDTTKPWKAESRFTPGEDLATARSGYEQWLQAVERSRGLAYDN